MTNEEFYDAVDILSEAWERLVRTIEEAVSVIREFFERERQKAESTPRRYGMSLIKVYGQSVLNWDYQVVGRKNLPYQRRVF